MSLLFSKKEGEHKIIPAGKSFWLFLFLFSGIIFFSGAKAQAATYYVDSAGGSDSNSGLVSSPFKTIRYAASRATQSGDIIHANAGTFTETAQINLNSGVTLEGSDSAGSTIIKAGFAANPLISAASSNEGTDGLNQEIRNLKIDGNNLTGILGIDVTKRKNVKIHHCFFINFQETAVRFSGHGADGEPAVYATGNEFYNNSVTNCTKKMSGWNNGAVQIGGQDGLKIHDNTITEISRGTNSGEAIVFWNLGYLKGLSIYNNTLVTTENYDPGYIATFAIELWNVMGGVEIYNNNITGNINFDTVKKGNYAYGLYIHSNTIKYDAQSTMDNKGICFDGPVTDVTISDNYIKNMDIGVFFYLRVAKAADGGKIAISNVNIDYNIFDGVGKAGGGNGMAFQTMGADYLSTFSNLKIRNNVIYARYSDMSVGIGLKSYGAFSNFYAQNNIIQGALVSPIQAWSDQPASSLLTGVYVQNNDFYGNSNNSFVNKNNFVASASLTNQGNITSDPLFVSTSGFHLQSASPVKDVGVNVGLATDFSGNSVPQGSGVDIGALEYPVAPASSSSPAPKTYGVVDFTKLLNDWFKVVSGSASDVNGDGSVNVQDLGIMMSNWAG